MKKLLCLLAISAISACCYSQTVIDGRERDIVLDSRSVIFIHYTYDNAGNIINKSWMLGTLQNLFSNENDEQDERKNLVRRGEVSISANPSWSSVQVSIAGENVENGTLYVSNLSGTLFGIFPFSGNKFSVDLSSAGKGLYLFKIETQNFTKEYKIYKKQ